MVNLKAHSWAHVRSVLYKVKYDNKVELKSIFLTYMQSSSGKLKGPFVAHVRSVLYKVKDDNKVELKSIF